MQQALIQAQHISKNYGEMNVVNAVNFAIGPKEIVTIIGPNGAGKTTLLKLLLGLQKPDTGTVTRKEKLSVGYMPQHLNAPGTLPMTVEYFLNLLVEPDASILAMLGVDHYLNRPLHLLSGGQWRRVLLARALCQKPDLLVLDEPTQGIDIHGQAEFYQYIAQAREQLGCAVLIISHDLHIVMAASDRVVCMQHHICCEGSAQKVQSDPAFTEMFGERLAAQLAIYQHDHGHKHDDAGHVVALKASGACAHE